MEYKEIWLDVIGYEGLYQVSNLGRVKSIRRKKQIIMNPTVRNVGYCCLTFYKRDVKKMHDIHRLVCQTFLPNPYNKKTVNHINGIKTDNRLINLEWSTQKENVNHASLNGLRKDKGEHNNFSKLTNEEVYKIKYLHKDLTQVEIGKIYGVKQSTISSILLGQTWKHI
jgi:hypothetical protein